MSMLTLFKREVPAVVPEAARVSQQAGASLEDVLAALTKYGRPRLHCHDNMTWSCTVDLNTNASGAEFAVRSDFNKNATPLAAALQCFERVRVAVRSIGGAA